MIFDIIDVALNENCYNPVESHGEICVGCGCCSDDPQKRAKARYELHERLLKDRQNFSLWCEDNPELFALQKKNIAEDIRYHTEKMSEYKAQMGGE